MLETLITSKTRIKLLTKFFINPQSKAYLRGLEESFGESSNAVRIELNRFEYAGLLNSKMEGNRKVYTTNTKHPLFSDIHNILRKQIGINHIIDVITTKLGQIEQIWLSGEFAKGNNSNTIELFLIGSVKDQSYLEQLINKVENLINRTIKIQLLNFNDFDKIKLNINTTDIFLLWESNK